MDVLKVFLSQDFKNLGLLLIAFVGVCLTLKQMKQKYKTQKAVFFKELYSTMFSDQEIRNAFYKIEYNKFKYEHEFHGSEEEKCMDRLLSFVDLICDFYDQKILTKREMSTFKYEFLRIFKNENIKKYLEFLKDFYKLNQTETEPFSYFRKYCLKISMKN